MLSSETPRPAFEVQLPDLERDPYPTYASLRATQPVAWIEPLRCWWVTRYEDVRELLLDDQRFTTVGPDSPVLDTFGSQVLSSHGPEHDTYRLAAQPAFVPRTVRTDYEAIVRELAGDLLATFQPLGEADLRTAFACRLPVMTMLRLMGLPLEAEKSVRSWYDLFERRLADATADPSLREAAQAASRDFQRFVALRPAAIGSSLLGDLMRSAVAQGRISPEAATRNLAIIFFGGISTVEALTLNVLWALFTHPAELARAQADPSAVSGIVEETMRWMSPVQSATRFVLIDTEFRGVRLRAGEKVAGMIGSANRDPSAFEDADRFKPLRVDGRRHLGFALGSHLCLGLHLARAEATIAIQALLAGLPELAPDPACSTPPEGFEFRQPRSLYCRWRTP